MLPNALFEQHKHVGLDLDETLAETFSGVLDFAHKNGKLLSIPTIEYITSYDFKNIDPSITALDSMYIWEGYGKDTMNPISVPIISYAKEGVQLLIQMGHEISIITARSDREVWKVERTTAWILAHFPEIETSNITFVNHFHEDAQLKSGACKLHGVTLLIDDSIENAYDLSREGIETIILEKPWNRDIIFEHPLVHRVKNWQEIIKNIPIYV